MTCIRLRERGFTCAYAPAWPMEGIKCTENKFPVSASSMHVTVRARALIYVLGVRDSDLHQQSVLFLSSPPAAYLYPFYSNVLGRNCVHTANVATLGSGVQKNWKSKNNNVSWHW